MGCPYSIQVGVLSGVGTPVIALSVIIPGVWDAAAATNGWKPRKYRIVDEIVVVNEVTPTLIEPYALERVRDRVVHNQAIKKITHFERCVTV